MTGEHQSESLPGTTPPARRRLRPLIAIAVLVAAVRRRAGHLVGVPSCRRRRRRQREPDDDGRIGPDATTTTTPAPTTTTTGVTTTTAPARLEPRATRIATPAAPPGPGVRLTLRLDRTTVVAGEDFIAVLVIENGSSEDLVYSGNACYPYHNGLYRDGSYVGGDPVRNCRAIVVPPVVVPPGAVKEVTLTFTTDGNRYDEATGTASPLPPGLFQVSAGIHQRDADNGDLAWFAPAVDLEIRAAS